MRIAFAVPAPLDAVSGGYAYDRRILAGLRELGHEIRLEEMPGRHPLPDDTAEEAARAVLGRLSEREVLVVDGLSLPSFAPLAGEPAMGNAIGLIHHPTALETGFPETEREALRERERALFPRLARLVTTSPLTADRLAPEFGADPARIGTVEPGTDPAPRAKGSGGPGCAILAVGALVPRKGHDVLLRALGRLTDIEWKLTIAGGERDPVHACGLRALTEELGIAARVTFAGEVGDEALEALFAATDLFASASHWEGYGMAVAEALAHGLPLAITAGGALADLAPRDAAVICAPGDANSLSRAMRRPIYDAGLREAMSEAAWRAGQRLPRWTDRAEGFAREIEAALPERRP
ncbi:glycosyltransferase family 4 protein [Muricoccus pecuniae]|uniref:Glycosyltransferase involved in cell wall biosynthesis n=1 Tax=Muricoccus pecuniae TaxID=693023 RepID=A0A840YC58_9PROT|nr:glycosyltransferase family 4 protein [Roseomonas pecuniae]MBB5693671.1 glycosyltransferase involved in cell wall biosynthesis [Roseomonas pecuniae]